MDRWSIVCRDWRYWRSWWRAPATDPLLSVPGPTFAPFTVRRVRHLANDDDTRLWMNVSLSWCSVCVCVGPYVCVCVWVNCLSIVATYERKCLNYYDYNEVDIICHMLMHYARRNVSVKRAQARSVNVYGHTTLKAPVLVRSPKLSNVGPG